VCVFFARVLIAVDDCDDGEPFFFFFFSTLTTTFASKHTAASSHSTAAYSGPTALYLRRSKCWATRVLARNSER